MAGLSVVRKEISDDVWCKQQTTFGFDGAHMCDISDTASEQNKTTKNKKPPHIIITRECRLFRPAARCRTRRNLRNRPSDNAFPCPVRSRRNGCAAKSVVCVPAAQLQQLTRRKCPMPRRGARFLKMNRLDIKSHASGMSCTCETSSTRHATSWAKSH